MKIIFLDVDGVLNHSQCVEWAYGSPYVLDEECIKQLRRILMYTDGCPRIVLSSTWRLSEEGCKAVHDAVDFFDDEFTFLGRTPALWHGKPRKDEILKWLQDVWPLSFGWNGETITHMAVIDDETDADLGDGSFFKTSFEGGGLTKEIADRIIVHLNKVGS